MKDSYIVEIFNPLTFLNKQYLDNYLLDKYPNATYEFHMLNGIPKRIDVILSSPEEVSSIFAAYNNKFFNTSID